MISKFLLYVLIIFVLFSCSKMGSIEEAIGRKIHNSNESPCIFDLRDLTEFDWDTAYFFQIPVSSEFVANVLGKEYSQYKEFTRPWIFTKDGKVVYSENNKSSVESIVSGQVVFGSLLDTVKIKRFTSVNSVFSGNVRNHDGIQYFELFANK